jgi:hypothetical protein
VLKELKLRGSNVVMEISQPQPHRYSELKRVSLIELGVKVHAFNLGYSTQEVDIKRISTRGHPRQKVGKTPISTNGWAWYHPSSKGSTNRKIKIQASQGIK